MNISIVIPLLNEENSLEELYNRINDVCIKNGLSYDLWFIDDGSTDNSWEVIRSISKKNSCVHALKFNRNYGKSQALHAAFMKVQGEVIITMDADLQDFPEEIPEFYKMIQEGDYDIVSGWKKKRFDNVVTKNLPSKLFNSLARKVSGIFLHDFNCGIKAYKKKVVKSIDVYGDMHRYIPVLAANAGFKKITEKEVKHQARPYGVSKFGSNRFTRGFLDLITLWFISRFCSRPMHFFGSVGILMFVLGFFCVLGLATDKIFSLMNRDYGRLISENSLFYISLTMMILGVQLFIAGFLGEMLIRNNRENKNYHIEETIGIADYI